MSLSVLPCRFLGTGAAVGFTKLEMLRMKVDTLGVPLGEDDGAPLATPLREMLGAEDKGGTTTEPLCEEDGTPLAPPLREMLGTEDTGGTTTEFEEVLGRATEPEDRGGTTTDTEPELREVVGRTEDPGGGTMLLEELELAEEAEGGLTLLVTTDDEVGLRDELDCEARVDDERLDEAEVVCRRTEVDVVPAPGSCLTY